MSSQVIFQEESYQEPKETHCQVESFIEPLADTLASRNDLERKIFDQSTKYVLKSMNSIDFYEGRIFDQLNIPEPIKQTKCNCVKSNCRANYCECMKNGNVCSERCTCKNCQNTHRKSEKDDAGKKGCNCKKSRCVKGYCDCFNLKEKCGSYCRCLNCHNKAPKS